MSAVLIVNPRASAVDEARLERVVAELPAGTEIRRTERAGHATELAREACAAGVDAIYVFSGDGGFNEVLNGVDASTPVGLVPGGGNSVMPRALGLPRDPVAAARQVAAGRPAHIALGRADGRRFAFSLGMGIDAEAVRRVDELGRRPDGRRPGDVRFALAILRLIASRRYAEPHIEVEVDGHSVGRVAFALVGNLAPYSFVGPLALRVHPQVVAEAGLDVVGPERLQLRSVPRFAAYVFRGKGQERARDVVHLHDVERLVLRADRPLPVQVDGEDLGDREEVVVTAEREAVALLL